MLTPPASWADKGAVMTPEDKRKSNIRLALILASVALVFALGFMAKIALLGR